MARRLNTCSRCDCSLPVSRRVCNGCIEDVVANVCANRRPTITDVLRSIIDTQGRMIQALEGLDMSPTTANWLDSSIQESRKKLAAFAAIEE